MRNSKKIEIFKKCESPSPDGPRSYRFLRKTPKLTFRMIWLGTGKRNPFHNSSKRFQSQKARVVVDQNDLRLNDDKLEIIYYVVPMPPQDFHRKQTNPLNAFAKSGKSLASRRRDLITAFFPCLVHSHLSQPFVLFICFLFHGTSTEDDPFFHFAFPQMGICWLCRIKFRQICG